MLKEPYVVKECLDSIASVEGFVRGSSCTCDFFCAASDTTVQSGIFSANGQGKSNLFLCQDRFVQFDINIFVFGLVLVCFSKAILPGVAYETAVTSTIYSVISFKETEVLGFSFFLFSFSFF